MFNTLRFRKVYFCDLWLLEGANWGNQKRCWYVILELHYIAPWIVCLSVWGSKRRNVVSNLFVSIMFTCIHDECLWYLLLLFLQCCMSLLDRCVQSVYHFLLEGKRFIYCALFEKKYVYIICKGEAQPRNQRHELWPMRSCMGSPTPHPTMFLCPKCFYEARNKPVPDNLADELHFNIHGYDSALVFSPPTVGESFQQHHSWI